MLKHRLVIAYARFRKLAHRPSAESSLTAVVIPPASPGGLGDDALVTSLLEQLEARGVQHVRMGTWDASDRWASPIPVTYFPLPGGNFRSWACAAENILSARSLFVLGADMLDGYYGSQHSLLLLRLADLAARLGLPATVVGSSFSDHPAPAIGPFLRSMSLDTTIFARDGLSQERLSAARGCPAPLSADIAFLLKPAEALDSSLVRSAGLWVDQQREEGETFVLGCNINSLPLAKSGMPLAELVRLHAEAIVQLQQQLGRVAIMMLPHDRRAPHDDAEGLAALDRLLPAGIPRCRLLLDHTARAAELKSIAGRCDFVLTGRMHLAIAALGSGTPTMCIGYQGKYDGLYRHFGLEGMVIPFDEIGHPDRLTRQLAANTAQAGALRDQIREKLPVVKALSLRNIPKAVSIGIELPLN